MKEIGDIIETSNIKIITGRDKQLETFYKGIAFALMLVIALIFVATTFCLFLDIDVINLAKSYGLVFLMALIVFSVWFFKLGLKNIPKGNVGILDEYQARDFQRLYGEGLWWVSPLTLSKFELYPNTIQKADTLKIDIVWTKNGLALENIEIKIYYTIQDLRLFSNSPGISAMKDYLLHELRPYFSSKDALEILNDNGISDQLLKDFSREIGSKYGVLITHIFIPPIRFSKEIEDQSKEYQRKKLELKIRLERLLVDREEALMKQEMSNNEMQMFVNKLNEMVLDVGMSPSEASEFLLIYGSKLKKEIHETRHPTEMKYTLETGDNILKIIELATSFLKK